jgi:hypothetical protein
VEVCSGSITGDSVFGWSRMFFTRSTIFIMFLPLLDLAICQAVPHIEHGECSDNGKCEWWRNEDVKKDPQRSAIHVR